MADKRIQDLTPATSVQTNDLFVLEQSGAAKSLSGQILINDLATALSGHGGITSITYTPPVAPSLDGTLTITMADTTTSAVTVTNGNGIDTIGVEYGISNDGTDPAYVQSWNNTPVAPTDQYPYGWTKIAITDITGNTTNAYSITVKADDPTISIGTVAAASGTPAAASITNSGTAHDPVLNFSFTLPQGDKGDTGDYVEPIVSFGTSQAAATEPGTWYNDPSSISYAAGNYIWRKTEYTLHDAQTVQDTVKEIVGYIGQNGSGSGTVTQITFNGDVYTDDGTGNVTMTVDASDVGAIEDPSTKSNGQVLTYDSSAGEWVAANPSTGNVNTVNSKGVDAGTTNITLYASDIKMSSLDNTTIPNAIPSASSTTPADLGTAAAGSGTTWARADHVHKMPTASDVGALPSSTTIPSASSSTPADLGTAAVGTSSKYARADHVHKRPAASDVGAMGKWKLLWTNSSPSSSFSAKTVALSLSGYNLVYVEAYVPDFSCLVGGFGVVGASYRTQLFSAVNGRHVRNFTASTSGVTFTKGESAGGQTQGVSDNNATMIPYKIYGIKGME